LVFNNFSFIFAIWNQKNTNDLLVIADYYFFCSAKPDLPLPLGGNGEKEENGGAMGMEGTRIVLGIEEN
jgi:hypothetical protein